MRLFLIGLLALGSARAFSVVRTLPLPQPHPQLVAYAPARGEFPVVSGLAQGYVRYYDGTGAERLLAYNYPEPLNGIRDLATSSANLIRSGQEQESQQVALFRAWCEQRYQAMRQELERLKAQGLKPSPSMMAQFEPLEQIVKFSAFEAVPGLSPEVQRARDEQLRIWNEARLEVLRAEQAQQQLGQYQDQFQTKKPDVPLIYGQQQFVQGQDNLLLKTASLSGPQPVEETPEVKLAREEHLKQFNEALLRQPAQETPIVKTIPGIQQPFVAEPQPQPITQSTTTITQPQIFIKTSAIDDQQAPQPIEETPEVKRAREEHLKQYNEALLRQPATAEEPILKTTPIQPQAITLRDQQQAPLPIEETPEVKRAREEHLKQFNEAILRQPIDTQQQPLVPIAPIPLFAPQAPQIVKSSIEGPQPIQDTPEVKLAREQHLLLLNQAKIKAEDKVADIADLIRLEERERESERLQELELRKQEEKEAELERQREADRMREEIRLLEAERVKIELEDRQRLESERQAEQQELSQLKITTSSEKGTPEYLHKAEQFKIINHQAQAQPQTQPQAQPNIVTQQQSVQNGFFLRIQTNQPNAIQPSPTVPISSSPNPFLVKYTPQPQPLQPLQPLPIPILSKLKQEASYSASLDKATREHFRAHEIALEQLRLANLKNPWTGPDCQH
ncbi:trichohyalin [Drosophila serrata]|uniref:trichohyalin n=1 Tax=Drosophila serrata TaxID=7274 RepID=UPI000A1CF5F1|nr:trichohyalin [Drosophila serrata]